MASIIIEISPGELIDRLTILEIKPERLRDPVKLANVQAEHAALQTNVETQVDRSDALHVLHAELREVNLRLWDIEDEIRDCERRKDLGASFVALARSVYLTNDRRREVKRAINVLLGAALVDERPIGRRAGTGHRPKQRNRPDGGQYAKLARRGRSSPLGRLNSQRAKPYPKRRSMPVLSLSNTGRQLPR